MPPSRRAPWSPGRAAARLVLLLLLAVVPAAGIRAAAGMDDEEARREAVVAFVKSETPVPSLTVYRDDEVEFPLFDEAGAQDLIFYRVREGGLYQEESGRVVRVVLGTPAEWTVFLDRSTGTIYRIAGFASGSDFNALVRRFGHEIDRTHAVWLATGYAELAYPGPATLVTDHYEVRRAVEDALHDGGMSDADIAHHGRPWLERWRDAVDSALELPSVVGRDKGFLVRRMVVRLARGGRSPILEVRQLELEVAPSGAVTVAADEPIAVFGPSTTHTER